MQILWAKWNHLGGVEFSWEGDHGFPPAGGNWVRIGTDADIDEAMKTLDAFMADDERDA